MTEAEEFAAMAARCATLAQSFENADPGSTEQVRAIIQAALPEAEAEDVMRLFAADKGLEAMQVFVSYLANRQ